MFCFGCLLPQPAIIERVLIGFETSITHPPTPHSIIIERVLIGFETEFCNSNSLSSCIIERVLIGFETCQSTATVCRVCEIIERVLITPVRQLNSNNPFSV